MKTYKTAVNNLPPPIRIFLSGSIKFDNVKLDLKKGIRIIEADSYEEFNELSKKYEASAQRIKQTKPFVRFFFVSFHFPDIDEMSNVKDEPILIFLDLGSDGLTFAKYGDVYEVEPLEINGE